MSTSATFEQTVAALKAGRAAIFPTDTVYGLGVAVCYADSPRVVSELKQRDPNKPIAWLIESVEDLDRYAVEVTPALRKYAEEGWPGALTLIVQASAEVPKAFQLQQGSIGLRVPASKTAQALIREVGPLAASSANLANQPAPSTFAELNKTLTSKVVALQGDAEIHGTPSTVLDCTTQPFVRLR